MRAWLKQLFAPEVKAFNPAHSFCVSNVNRWRLCDLIAKIPGVAFTHKLRLFGSSEEPMAVFDFKDIAFKIDDGAFGGDGLWVEPLDGLPHPVELGELREQLLTALSLRACN